MRTAIKNPTYKIYPLSEGYMAKCEVNPEVSVYGKTRTEVFHKIELAIQEYDRLFTKKAK